MTTIALERERTLERLAPEKGLGLETRVREAILEMEEELPALEEMKQRIPEFADIIGCWADKEFELTPEVPLPRAKTW